MNTLDNFKLFVKKNPSFAKYIKDGTMTWQKFYELYDMYGEDSNIWDEFKSNKKSTSINDIINLAKNIDMNKFQDGINSLSKAVSLFSDLFVSKSNNNEYSTKRAIYQRFDD